MPRPAFKKPSEVQPIDSITQNKSIVINPTLFAKICKQTLATKYLEATLGHNPCALFAVKWRLFRYCYRYS